MEGQSTHTHDVTSLLVVHGGSRPPQLLSGGQDAQLFAIPVARHLKVLQLLLHPAHVLARALGSSRLRLSASFRCQSRCCKEHSAGTQAGTC